VAVVPLGRDDPVHIANRNEVVGLVAPVVAEVVAVLRFPLSRSMNQTLVALYYFLLLLLERTIINRL